MMLMELQKLDNEMKVEEFKSKLEHNKMSVWEYEYTFTKINEYKNILGPNKVLILAHSYEQGFEFLTIKLFQRGLKLYNMDSFNKKCDCHYIVDEIIKKIIEINVPSVRRENLQSVIDAGDNRRLFKMVKGG